MIRLFVNGLAASAGGGLTYLRNVVPRLGRRDDVEATVLLSPSLDAEFSKTPGVSFLQTKASSTTLGRFVSEQILLPKLIKKSGSQVLISTGNFALWRSPIPQILLSRNALYTSRHFLQDLHARRQYRMWSDTLVKGWFARQSIQRADLTLAPSAAFAGELSQWSGIPVSALHHGFDSLAFAANTTPLPNAAQAQLLEGQGALRLLFVSHYNYYRNFETLFRAISILKQRLRGRRVKLYLTCRLNSSDTPGSYRAEVAAALAQELRSNREIVELGSIPYSSLHHVYRLCHIYVTPAYAESFAHPLVEAMSSGLPIVASDLPVHHEICRNAAVYFSCFSPSDLADCVLQVEQNRDQAAELSTAGRIRARDFSWDDHVARLVEFAEQLVRELPARGQ